MINYAPVDDVEKAPNCAMLFILAEKEEYFDNKDHGIEGIRASQGAEEARHDPRNHALWHLRLKPGRRPSKLAIAWFDEHLKGQKPPPPRRESNRSVGLDVLQRRRARHAA